MPTWLDEFWRWGLGLRSIDLPASPALVDRSIVHALTFEEDNSWT
jgi:hypothetical protein